MREQVLRSSALGSYGLISQHMPEVLDDATAERQSSRAARKVLERATLSALDAAFGDRFASDAPPGAGSPALQHGFRFGRGPEWFVGRRGPGSGIRLSVPLVPGPVRLRAWLDVTGNGPNARRIGASFGVDPFTQTVSCGFTFRF